MKNLVNYIKKLFKKKKEEKPITIIITNFEFRKDNLYGCNVYLVILILREKRRVSCSLFRRRRLTKYWTPRIVLKELSKIFHNNDSNSRNYTELYYVSKYIGSNCYEDAIRDIKTKQYWYCSLYGYCSSDDNSCHVIMKDSREVKLSEKEFFSIFGAEI